MQQLQQDQLVRSEVGADERVLWSGQPLRGHVFSGADLLLVPFSLLWAGFALFWEASALGLVGPFRDHRPPFFFALWGIPFVLVGLYMVVGRFAVQYIRNGRTLYILTDRRAITVTTLLGHRVASALLHDIPTVSKSVRTDGSGTITFGSASAWGDVAWPGGMNRADLPRPVTFRAIPDVARVYDLVMHAGIGRRAEEGPHRR